MNKRIKLKKGILHKKCDDKCVNYRIVVDKGLVTSNICVGCKHKAIIEKICKKNCYKSVKDNRQRYEGKCCNCGATFYACKSLGIEIGWLDAGHGRCIKCNTSLALMFDDEKQTVVTVSWDEYRNSK